MYTFISSPFITFSSKCKSRPRQRNQIDKAAAKERLKEEIITKCLGRGGKPLPNSYLMAKGTIHRCQLYRNEKLSGFAINLLPEEASKTICFS